jgi:hypothetical protein
VMWVMLNLVSFYLEAVLVSVQDRFTVCVERNIGSDIILDTLDGTPRLWVMWNLTCLHLGTMLVSVQDRFTVF